MSTVNPHGRGGYGFTLVELIVVIAVLAILIPITVSYISGWRDRTAQTEVKNNLSNAAAAMENSRNFNNGYPGTIPGTFTASTNVTVQLKTSTSSDFCIDGQSTAISSIRYYVTSKTGPTAGTCP